MVAKIVICNKHLDDIEAVKQPMNVVITGKVGNSNVVDRFCS
jgi:hypothetical protein